MKTAMRLMCLVIDDATSLLTGALPADDNDVPPQSCWRSNLSDRSFRLSCGSCSISDPVPIEYLFSRRYALLRAAATSEASAVKVAADRSERSLLAEKSRRIGTESCSTVSVYRFVPSEPQDEMNSASAPCRPDSSSSVVHRGGLTLAIAQHRKLVGRSQRNRQTLHLARLEFL